MEPLERIRLAGLVPVVVINDAEKAVPAAKAILAGGLDTMEITMRTDAGIQAIRNVSEACPEMLVGAGTVLTLEKCQEAVEAGAKFIVAPGFNEKIVGWCVENNVAVTPGCVTPTEIEAALSFGLHVMKFFPAGTYGGVQACKSLYGPYRAADVSFIPTGGVSDDNLTEYADKPFIHAVGGSWLCRSGDIDQQNFTAITEAVRKSIDILLGFELAHIGINGADGDQSFNLVNRLNQAFNFPIKQGNSSDMAGSWIEVTHQPYLGEHGHIAIRTNNLDRAIHYLGKRGFKVNESSAKYKNGRMIAIYLEEEMGGFAYHLLQK
ncbi:MAG: bifunctional 4-hydroxy-2-oxoglutarate aldolase/2-dehydro-3-deoxy-phosphogluconate aldolase [Anaerolineaceae bacterium]|nr:bifunctional 4-hydroxy-2-oxoglutarate aldolase/2-dehydro-3-deoxy-phosphogluconate aldolase [Anaerolineaceae bacterium]